MQIQEEGLAPSALVSDRTSVLVEREADSDVPGVRMVVLGSPLHQASCRTLTRQRPD